jgi:anti-sigma-K factor RskA
MSESTSLPDDDDLLAAELALGLLQAEERTAAEAHMLSNPRFAAAHARWAAHFLDWLSGHEEMPAPSIWARIEARIPTNDIGKRPGGPVHWWQIGALMTISALAASLAMVMILQPADKQPMPKALHTTPPEYVATLTGEHQAGVVTVSFNRTSGRLLIAPARLAIGQHSAELWAIPADGKPRSLGVISEEVSGRSLSYAGPAQLIAPGVTLAISVEPVGGSQTGAPTGPVILTGKISAI